jgi:hypothetical protein
MAGGRGMVALSNSEQILYNYLLEHRGREVPISELVEALYKGRDKPAHEIGSVAAMMRTTMLKSEILDIPTAKRCSRLGRGAVAFYTIEGEG